ncbi:MAG: sulfatase-like hydrolase/transferase [Planctomycetota bacterium]
MVVEPGGLAGCNVLLVTLDTTRADRLGCYGNRNIETPNIDALAMSGVLFANAIAPTPVTLPSHSTMMTGRHPKNHGVRFNALARLGDEERTLAEVLSESGYATAAFVSAFVLDSRYGISQGFETYDLDYERRSEHWAAVAERPADKTCDQALAWLDVPGRGDRPFFLWVHLFDPHWTYEPPKPYADRYAGMLYDGEIAFADAQLGRLLDALDELALRDKTLIVVAGDHGESLGQHDEHSHGTLVYDATLHVPLVLNAPRQPGGGVCITRPVGLVDLMPTVLAMLGVAPPDGMDGVDLTLPPSGPRSLFFETFEGMAEYGWAPYLGVQRGVMKYIYGPVPELYNLADDPLELHDLIASQAQTADALHQEVRAFFGDDLEEATSLDLSSRMSPAELAKLQSLGYVFGGVEDKTPMKDRLDARKMITLLYRVNQAFNPAEEDWINTGIAEVESIVRDHPDFYVARRELGVAYAVRGDLEAAEAEYRHCLELRPDIVMVKVYLAGIKERQGYFQEAIQMYREILGQAPDDVLSLRHLGALLLRTQVYDQAAEILLLAHGFMPQEADIAMEAATALAEIGRGDEAIDLLGKLLESSPHETAVRTRLTRLLRTARRHSEAVALLRDGLRLYPDNLDMAANLAIHLTEWADPMGLGPQEALAIMERLCEQTHRSNAGYLHALGRVYARLGRMDEAIAASTEARDLAANAGETRLAGTIDHDLAGFTKARAELGALIPGGAPVEPIAPSPIDAQNDDD